MLAIKVTLSVLILVWIYVGYYLITRFHKLFGTHPDDPAETPGARSFGLAHIVSIWIGIIAMLIYFLQK